MLPWQPIISPIIAAWADTVRKHALSEHFNKIWLTLQGVMKTWWVASAFSKTWYFIRNRTVKLAQSKAAFSSNRVWTLFPINSICLHVTVVTVHCGLYTYTVLFARLYSWYFNQTRSRKMRQCACEELAVCGSRAMRHVAPFLQNIHVRAYCIQFILYLFTSS